MIVMGCQISRQFMQFSFRDTADDVEDLLPDRFGGSRSYAFARGAASPLLSTTAGRWTWHSRIIDGKRTDGQAFVRIPRGRAMGAIWRMQTGEGITASGYAGPISLSRCASCFLPFWLVSFC